MKRPRSILNCLDEGRQFNGIGLTSKECARLIRYIQELEQRAESAEAYAAKHADMYVEEQNRRAKEERSQ